VWCSLGLLGEDPDRAGLPAFTGPSLILVGRQDIAVGYVDQFSLLTDYPRAILAVLDVAGHNLQIEQPVLFAALAEEWLERVAAES
jgi:pimeloyl-ACP methyl ester carboxylesterase